MTLTDFLQARLTEDLDALAGSDCDCEPGQETAPGCAARLQADIAAKQEIVKDADYFLGAGDGLDAERVLYLLAKPYRWHPDYQQEWAP